MPGSQGTVEDMKDITRTRNDLILSGSLLAVLVVLGVFSLV
ncbi:hypothetical protein BH09ACT10_BH09ACT10_07680 [soil metagenome]